MKRQSIKVILSTLLMLIVLFLAVTGTMLFFGKTGLVLGISRKVLREIHFYVAVSMCVLVAVHLVLNCKLYLAGLRALLKIGNRE